MKRLLLFIDDNTTLLSLLSRSFSEYYNVVGFARSDDAMHYMETNIDKLDIILSDYKMPSYNGMQILRRAKELKSNTVRILFTAYGELEDVVKGKDVYTELVDKNLLKDTKEILKVIQQASEKKGNFF